MIAHTEERPTTRRHIWILIVDDHAIVREGLRAILETERDFEVVGQASDAREAHRCFLDLRPDVTLLDLRLGEESGLDVLRDIRGIDPEARVLMISAYGHPEDVHRALVLGARGYVLKELGGEEIVAAVHAIYRGGRLIPRLEGR